MKTKISRAILAWNWSTTFQEPPNGLRQHAPWVYGLWTSMFAASILYVGFVCVRNCSSTAVALPYVAFALVFFAIHLLMIKTPLTQAGISRFVATLALLSLLLVLSPLLIPASEATIPGWLKVGFSFGNQGDFYGSTMNQKIGGNEWQSKSGYLPLALFLGILEGKLMGWNGLFYPQASIRQPQAFMIYCLTFVACLSPLFINIKRLSTFTLETRILLAILLICSYPFLFSFERGNYVIFAAFWITLYISSSEEGSTGWLALVCLILVLSLTVKYWIFAPLLLLFSFTQVVSGAFLFTVLQAICWYLILPYNSFHFDVFASGTFANIFSRGDLVSWNSERIFAYTGLDGLFRTMITLYKGETSDFEFKAAWNSSLSICLFSTLAFYFTTLRQSVPAVYSALLVVLTMSLFHPSGVDYNLLLTAPMLVSLIRLDDKESRLIAMLLMAIFVPVAVLSFFDIQFYTSSYRIFVSGKQFVSVSAIVCILIMLCAIAYRSKGERVLVNFGRSALATSRRLVRR